MHTVTSFRRPWLAAVAGVAAALAVSTAGTAVAAPPTGRPTARPAGPPPTAEPRTVRACVAPTSSRAVGCMTTLSRTLAVPAKASPLYPPPPSLYKPADLRAVYKLPVSGGTGATV